MKLNHVLIMIGLILGLSSLGYIATTSYRKSSSTCPIIGENLKLGKVEFDKTSTSSSVAHAHFLLGLRYLHNFMYPPALREFKLAKQSDPDFAMSYWGIAMSYHWALWSFTDKAQGLKALYELDDRKNSRVTPLEKALIDAVWLLYDEKALLENDKQYMRAMKKLYQKYPNNPEIVSFYALALLGYASDAPSDQNNAVYLEKARKILKPFLTKYPQHPGIIHYYMHATDIPNSSVPREGLAAIHNIYNYMSDSSHVLHMPSHLYTELGMWPEAMRANQLSMQASTHLCQFFQAHHLHFDAPLTLCSTKKPIKWTEKDWHACDADNLYHSAEWLHYELLQTGQFEKAAQIVEHMKKVVNIEEQPMYMFWWYRTQARQMLYSGRWYPIEKLPEPLVGRSDDVNWAAYSESTLLLTYGLRAIRYHQVALLAQIDDRFQRILEALKIKNQGSFYDACLLMKTELLAAKTYYVDKNFLESEKWLKKALSIEHRMQAAQQTLTLPLIPAQELYATILLHQNGLRNKNKAMALYKEELAFYPGRKVTGNISNQ